MACSAFGQIDSTAARSADTTANRFFIGPFGMFGAGIESAGLVIPGFTADCGTLRTGKSLQWMAGGLFELPLAPAFAVQFRAAITGFNGSLTAQIPGARPVWLGAGVGNAVIDHEVDFKGLALEGSLLARLALTGRLHAQGGIALGRWIRSDQSYKQVAVAPAELLFANNRREFVVYPNGVYSTAPVVVSALLGIAYDLPIGRRSTLSPELTATIPLTSNTLDGPWRSFSIGAGAALRFGFARAAAVVPPPPRPDTQPVAPRPPTLVTAVATEPRIVSVRIDEHDSLEMLSLLNQVFFTEGSADLRPAYHSIAPAESRAFTDTTLLGSALDVYYDMLNIVGYRMRATLPEATLTINGYRNGNEPSPALARARAESIKRYLVNTWSIAPERIRVKGGAAPPNPSRETSPQGMEENARAELSASDPNVLGPILRRHIIRSATPPAVTFYPQALAEAGVARWSLETVEDENRPWRTFSGVGAPPDSIVWNWQNNAGNLPAVPLHLSYRLSVTDSSGRTTTTAVTDIDVVYESVRSKLEHRVNDTTIETYSLLLFNFDNPRVSPSDRELLGLIATIIKSKARVRLIGYTDSLGDPVHNHELATERAQDVARILRKLLPNDVSITVDESGGERERFPYSTPEGRSHCRTVFIDVRTPTLPNGS